MYFIGLMSGTSADGIDLALVRFTKHEHNEQATIELVASYFQSYQAELAQRIKSLYDSGNHEIDLAGSLDIELAHLFSKAIITFLQQQNMPADAITAIGNHGQTIRHRPSGEFPFTLQIGCSQTIACLTGINVVGQFRQKDIALGGQGAPLVPAFHQQLFNNAELDVFFVNIGGIANISYLPKLKEKSVQGFDTGPGNALLDDWFVHCNPEANHCYDESGQWGILGTVNQPLLAQLLSDPYFSVVAPKSTGREYFTFAWLEQQLSRFTESSAVSISAQDIQATLVALTANSITDEIQKLSQKAKVIICGGGVHNDSLMKQLANSLHEEGSQNRYDLVTASELGIDGDSLEAMAFAWLAYAHVNEIKSNMPSVTGASHHCVLGLSYSP